MDIKTYLITGALPAIGENLAKLLIDNGGCY